jgi:transposase
MTDKDLYQQILGLTSPWRVSDIELRVVEEEILVRVEHDPALGQVLCPECRRPCPGYDTSAERRWRHLDTCQLKTFLVCSIPRVNCPEHGVRVGFIPWAEPGANFTVAFEILGITVLKATKVQGQAAALLRLSANQVYNLMHRAVGRGLVRRDKTERIEHIGMDEKAIRRGHTYMTVLSDTEQGRVIDVVEERTLQAASSLLLDALSPEQRAQVRSVSMDMWAAFMSAQEQALPHADRIHDRFHVAKYLSDAVDKTRRAEQAQLSEKGDRSLDRSKYVWLTENMTARQKEMFATLATSGLETSKVWGFKDTFREFFGCIDIAEATAFFQNWFEGAKALGNKYLTKVADMLNDHLVGLVNYVKHRTTNATAEGLNSQIQQIKASARGYRRFPNFRVAVLFHLGQLDLYPHKPEIIPT